MGTDIQIFLEFLLPNGTWIADEYHKNEADRDPEMGLPAECRDYDLFAALAGIRGQGPKPKGLPNDVSPHIKALDAMGSDNRDHSFVSIDVLESFDAILDRYKVDVNHPLYDNPFDDASPPYVSICAYAHKMLANEGYKDARIVFWFTH